MLFFALPIINLTACQGQKSDDDQRKIKLGVTWFWKGNSEAKFIAINFRQDSVLVCNAFPIGPNEGNEKLELEVTRISDNTFALYDKTNQIYGNIILKSDTVISLYFYGYNKEFEMVANSSQANLFNQMRAKYVFECIKGSDISFDNIIPHTTRIEPFLEDSTYIQKTEILKDEIYGTIERHYLEKGGNKFYYFFRGKTKLFDEVDIQSNTLSSTFLNIRIGDTHETVLEKMAKYKKFLRTTESSIAAMVCNQTYLGQVGTISFIFRRSDTADQKLVLSQILYKPLEEAN